MDQQDEYGFGHDDDSEGEFNYGEEGDEAEEVADVWETNQPEMRRGMRELDLVGAERDAFLTDANTALERRMMSPLDKFRNSVNSVARNLVNMGLTLSNEDVVRMLSKASEIENVGFKNPTAYVLGYWVVQNGTISKEKVEHIINRFIFRKVNDTNEEFLLIQSSVSGIDVVRYARYWTMHLIQ